MARIAKEYSAELKATDRLSPSIALQSAHQAIQKDRALYHRLRAHRDSLSHIDWDEFVSEAEKLTDSVESTADGIEEVESVFASIDELPTSDQVRGLSEQINELVQAIKSLRSSFAKKVLFVFICAVLQQLIAATFNEYLAPSHAPDGHAAAVREARQEVEALEAPGDTLSNLRIVKKRVIIAYESRKRKAEVVDVLIAGQVVHLIERQKTWCYVQWLATDSHPTRGWVRSKYLKRIKK